MEYLDIIKETESLLPNSFKNATIISDNKSIPLFEFLETKFVEFVKPGATPKVLADFINAKLSPIITLNDKRLIAVEEFINGNPTFKDIIQTGPNEVISARDYLLDYCFKHMRDDGVIEYLDSSITISELYIKLLNNEYHAPTLEEKAELCIYMTKYIDNEILSSIVDGMDMTVRDYITKVIPTKMDTIDSVAIKGERYPIDDFIKDIVDHQVEFLENNKKQEAEMRENENNKTSDNPGLVSEIQVSDDLQVTAEIPVVTSSLLTDAEKSSLLANYAVKEAVTSEEHYRSILNKLKESIDLTTNLHDLETKSKHFDSVVAEVEKNGILESVKPLIESVRELISNKQRNLIKVNGNLEEYTDVLFSQVNAMMDELNGFTTLDEYTRLYGKALERFNDLLSKKITDVQLKASFQLLFDRISEKRLNLDATIGYQSPEVERTKSDLNDLIILIKQDLLTIEHDSNNLGNLAGTQVRLNLNIEAARNKVYEAYSKDLLTKDDSEYFMNKLKGFEMALASEAQIGFGLR